MEKTNVMRLLDAAKISYVARSCNPEITDGKLVADAVGQERERVFKTLVAVSNTAEKLVFVIPVSTTLDLKKAAKAAGVKSVEMLPQAELLPLTGYVHGGCSPIGMKKQFRTFVDETAALWDSIVFSAGRRGCQVDMDPNKLAELVSATFGDITN